MTADLAADARALAAHHDWDAAALRHEYDRRSFGSFTTTLAGRPAERDRYRRAWELAVERENHR
jgi:hypothetical protein